MHKLRQPWIAKIEHPSVGGAQTSYLSETSRRQGEGQLVVDHGQRALVDEVQRIQRDQTVGDISVAQGRDLDLILTSRE